MSTVINIHWNTIPKHIFWSAPMMYPVLQLQIKDPFMLLHMCSHGPSPPFGKHSLMSTEIKQITCLHTSLCCVLHTYALSVINRKTVANTTAAIEWSICVGTVLLAWTMSSKSRAFIDIWLGYRLEMIKSIASGIADLCNFSD